MNAPTLSTASAPVSSAVSYHVELADRHTHTYRVTLTLPAPAAQQRLSLPVWIPGSYLVREFSRHLSGLQARQGRRAVALTQIDKCSWLAACSGQTALTLSYTVYAFDPSVRAAWLDSQRGFFNGTSLFLRADGHEAAEHRLTLGKLPAGWDVATGLQATAAGWTAPDYDALIDHPVELGPFWRGSFEACGVVHEFVVAGALPGFDGERLLADTQRICEAQIRFWHGDALENGPPPFDRYVFLLNAVADGYGGLEHRNSTALICHRRDLPMQNQPAQNKTTSSDGYVTLLGLISHEYFHTWNVKRLKPTDFAPYDLERENYTELLWFFEGFTSYYDDLFLVRTGLIDEARYTKLLAKTVNQVLGTPGRAVQSLAQASFDAWVKYYRPDENTANATVSYYTKGALVALALDLTLRGEGRGSLDHVMRLLWQRSEGGPISQADIAAALLSVGKRDYAAELADWVHGTADLPLPPLLEAQGLSWTRDAPTLAQRLGARVHDTTLKVQAVLRGGVAEQAGLAAGDELLAFDGWRLGRLDDLALLGAFQEAPTTPSRTSKNARSLLVSRDQRLLSLTLPGVSVGSDAEGAVSLGAAPKASAALNRKRRAWLGLAK